MRKGCVLVIGSAHLDVMGVYRDVETRDKQGKVRFSIGGAAYNVAANLGVNRVRVALFTYLAKGSALSDLVLRNIRKCGIITSYTYVQTLLHGERLSDSAFVAHWNEDVRDVASAVSYMAIGQSDWHEEWRQGRRLAAALRQASVVVIDCNLRPNTIRRVVQELTGTAKGSARTPLLVASVSETKCGRFSDLQLPEKEFAEAIVMYAEELAFLFGVKPENKRTFVEGVSSGNLAAPYRAAELCARTKSHHVIVAFTDHAMVFSRNGATRRIEMPHIVESVSTTGTRDAILAAFAAEINARSGRFSGIEGLLDLPEMRNRLDTYIERVRRVFGATPLSAIDFRQEDDSDHDTWLQRVQKRFRKGIGSALSDAIVQVILFLAVTAILLLLGYLLSADDFNVVKGIYERIFSR